MRFPCTIFTFQISFKTLLLGEGGGGVKTVVDVTVNSKEETLKPFVHGFKKRRVLLYYSSSVFLFKST